jgi:hypothetical protein
MSLRTILSSFSCLLLCSCVQYPVFKGDDYALITSNYPIVSVNGVDVEDTYRLDIEAGDNALVIVYNTYQHDYFCTFNWTASAATAYEVTDHEKRYPLTLYRWIRRNGLWAVRLDPVNPEECSIVSKADDG